MNYAELCRMYVAEHRENARFWTEDSAGTLYSKRYAKRATEIADLLDAAAGLYELNDPVSKGSPCKCGICTAMRAADAAAKRAE